MANRYWVGNQGSWNDTSHWSTTSGGSSGASYPTSADNAFFDANSFTVANRIVDMNYDSVNNLDFTGVTNTPKFVNGIYIYGDLTFSTGINYTTFGEFYFAGSGTQNLTSNGSNLNAYYIEIDSTGGTVLLQDDLTASTSLGTLILAGGTFDANNKNITVNTFGVFSYIGNCTLNMGSGTWTIGAQWSVVKTSTITINPSTSTIVFQHFTNGGTFSFDNETIGGDVTYNNITVIGYGGASTETFNFLFDSIGVGASNNLSFNNFTFQTTNPGILEVNIPSGHTYTMSSFTATGASSSQQIKFLTSSSFSTWSVGASTVVNAAAQNNHAAGVGTPISVVGGSDLGGNVNWSFIPGLSVNENVNIIESVSIELDPVFLLFISISETITITENYGAGLNPVFISKSETVTVTDWARGYKDLLSKRYWVGNGGGWQDTAHWSLTSGGASGAAVPTDIDRVIFDTNSFSSSGQTVTADRNSVSIQFIVCKSMDWSAVTNNPTFANGVNSCTILINDGDLILSPSMNVTVTSTWWLGNYGFGSPSTERIGSDYNINLAGHTLTNIAYTFYGYPTTCTLLSDINVTGYFFGVNATSSASLPSGPFSGVINTNNYNITSGAAISFGGIDPISPYGFLILNLGTSIITFGTTMNFNGNSSFNYHKTTVNGANATFRTTTLPAPLSQNFTDDGLSSTSIIGTLTCTSSAGLYVNMADSGATITNLILPPGSTLSIQPAHSLIVVNFTANGSVGNLITINALIGFHTPATLSASTASVSYVDVVDNTATGAASPFVNFPGGVNSGGNTNWLFTSSATNLSTNDTTTTSESVTLRTAIKSPSEIYQFFIGNDDNGNEISFNVESNNLPMVTFDSIVEPRALFIEVKEGNNIGVFVAYDDGPFNSVTTIKRGYNRIELDPDDSTKDFPRCRNLKIALREFSNRRCTVSRIGVLYNETIVQEDYHL